jgi:hypothetical protein
MLLSPVVNLLDTFYCGHFTYKLEFATQNIRPDLVFRTANGQRVITIIGV